MDRHHALAARGVAVITGAAHEIGLATMSAGDFYILCPDNEATRAMNNRRIQWAADDLIEERPALSR